MIKKMMNTIREYVLDIISVVTALAISKFYIAQGDLTTYIATPMAIADSSIFRQDFSIMAFMQPNAQSVSDQFCAFFLKLGSSWQMLSILGTIITTLVFAAGIIAISKHFFKKNSFIMSGFFMLFCLFSLSGLRIGRNQVWLLGFYYSQIAYSLCIWAFYFALKNKWKISFILIPIATLFHFTVGCYSAAFLVVFLLIKCIKEKQYKKLLLLIPWIVVCFAIFGIMVIGGSTSTGQLSNDLFVKIHCYLRHPHHHVPSSWEKVAWFNFIAYIAGIYLLLLSLNKRAEHFKLLNKLVLISTALVTAILIANYIFIEIIPVAFIAKLQPARSVFIFRTLLAGILAYIAAHMWSEKQYGIGALIALTACIPQVINPDGFVPETYSGFYILAIGIVAIIIYLSDKFNFTTIRHLAPVGYFIIFAGYIIRAENIYNGYDIYYKFIAFTAFMYILIMPIKENSRKIAKHLKRVFILFSACLVAFLPWFNIHTKEIYSVDSMFNSAASYELRTLAEEFQDTTDKDVIFFGDPMDSQTAFFRLYSQRSSVVAFKNMPFTDEAMLEWVKRLTDFGAIQIKDDGYFRTNEYIFKNTSPDDKKAFCNQYGAEYLLTKANEETLAEYTESGFTVYNNKGEWYILNVPE